MTTLPTRLRVSMGRAERSVRHQRSKTFGIPFFAVITLGIVFGASVVKSPAEASVVGTVALFAAWFMVMLLLDLLWSQPNTINVVARAEGMVFSPPWVVLFAVNGVPALALVSLARLWWVPEQWTHLAAYPRGMIVFGPLMGLAMIAETLSRLRRPAGLSLDERGLSGVRAGPRFGVVWADVAIASVAEGKKSRHLILASADGRSGVAIPQSTVSGDVYAVATVINYYVQHPEERGRLSDGLDAVRHVDAEVSAGRFDAT
jgi:hypothetical protein